MGLYQHFYTALYDLETQEFDLFYLFGVGQKVNWRVDPQNNDITLSTNIIVFAVYISMLKF